MASERDVRDPRYEIGHRYNKRVWLVDPQGVITVITEEEHKKMTHVRENKEGILITRQGRPFIRPKRGRTP